MSEKVNPVLLIQLMNRYNNDHDGPRTFRFTKNNVLKVHEETRQECLKRKSRLSVDLIDSLVINLYDILRKTLMGRINKKIWIDPEMRNIAIPLNESSGQSGFDILPIGSRVQIPEGKKIRAFTYWEKVNDIDLSCFSITEEGRSKEFSWRSMYGESNNAICFSGDQTSGYDGGSEYFDIDPKLFKEQNPDSRYILFCNNVFTGRGSIHFKDCFCKAGFMTRDITDSGEVYEPKTVKTSFRITSDSSFGYLFAIDLKDMEMIWLNMNRAGDHAIAGNTDMRWLMEYFNLTRIFNVYNLYSMCSYTDKGNNRVLSPKDADIVVTSHDDYIPLEEQEVIHQWDTEKMLQLLK